MLRDNSVRRLTLRQLITYTDKCSRDLSEHISTPLLTELNEFRDLSRPVRRRSHYPSLVAVQNALQKLSQAHSEVQELIRQMEEYLAEIREHAKREVVNRL